MAIVDWAAPIVDEVYWFKSLRSDIADRLLRFVHGLMQAAEVPEQDLRSGKHILAALYNDVSPRTLSRDLATVAGLGLIVRANGLTRINLALMEKYAATGLELP